MSENPRVQEDPEAYVRQLQRQGRIEELYTIARRTQVDILLRALSGVQPLIPEGA